MGLRQRYDWEGSGSKSWIDSTNRDGSSIECADCGNVESVKNITQHYLQGVK